MMVVMMVAVMVTMVIRTQHAFDTTRNTANRAADGAANNCADGAGRSIAGFGTSSRAALDTLGLRGHWQ
jgi:hypothetical protein